MIIESIEMDNFKSFGKKKKIEFKNGLTVISGPNGSGKSNIGDALLFVLGVRSTKSVRADRLSDLIHRSSDNDPGRKYCSVQINFDNGEDNDDPDKRRISIRRELTFDGTDYKSNYYIRDVRVKHSDVEQLLDSMKIYLDGYSFVLQGDINNLIKMTGIERRKLLEAIAGVESYNNQIESAKSDINGINENMIKLEVRAQDEKLQVDGLSHDKEVAEKYLQISSKMKDFRATLIDKEIARTNREISSLNKQISELGEQISSLENANLDLTAKVESLQHKKREIEIQRESVSGAELKEIRIKSESLKLKIAERKMSIQNKQAMIEDRQKRLDESEREIADILDQKKGFEIRLKTNSDDMQQLESEINVSEEKLRKLRANSESTSGKLTALKKKYSDLDAEVEKLSIKLGDLEVDFSEINKKKITKSTELSTLEERKSGLEFQIKDSLWRSKESVALAEEGKRSLKDLSDRFYALKAVIKDLNDEKDSLQKKLVDLNREYTRFQSASQGQKIGQSRAVSLIIGARNQNLIPGIHGPLKDIISFDEEFQMAVEATAGGRLNSIVVENDETSQKCIELLKREKAGRLTFLPINKMVVGRPRGKAIIVHNSSDSLGYVMERIQYDKKYEGAVWHAFQDTVIVPSVEIARKYMVGVKLVTKDGDIFDPSGAITGGFMERKKENFASEKKILDLSSEIMSANSRIDELSSIIKVKGAELDRLTEELNVKSREEGQKKARSENLDTDIEKIKSDLVKLSRLIEDVNAELSKFSIDYESKETEISSVKTLMRSKEREKSLIMEEMKTQNPEEAEMQEQTEKHLEMLKGQKSQISADISALNVEIKHVNDRLRELRDRVKQMKTEISEFNDFIASVATEQRQLESELSKSMAVEAELDRNTRVFTDAIMHIDAEITQIAQTTEINKGMCETKRSVIITLNGRIENLTEKLNNLNEELKNVGGKPVLENYSEQEIRKTILLLQSEAETLGPINYKAIEEYASVKAVLDSLEAELQTLRNDRKELEGLMDTLNKQKESIFVKTFNRINEGINVIYSQLSGGGEAQLIMSDINKPLESEVFIKARPKGKVFAKLQSLSGGEKSLTALAFIMSIQQMTPSPVYYLDEVDMYLDGGNVERIGQMFRSNSKISQILMVSLKKAMLKYADNIVGVTSFDQINTEVYEKTIAHEAGEF
ncbi:MAG: chromosome segregation protein SMC [Thermoplasmataceae archaeon]